jgi:muramoyltetrapeptide carboxypeptidase LdcA involved in peptidoglycan recycling
MLGKVYLVLDFDNDEQKNDVQEAFKEISNMRTISGRQVQQMYPFFRAHRQELSELFSMISQGGVKAIMSLRGAQLIKNISSKR